jgi:fucose permease
MTTTTPAPGLLAWRNAIFLIFALPGIAMATWVSRLPAVRDALEIRIDQVGILVFGIAAGSIIGLVLSGHIVAWLGARTTMLLGTLVIAVGIAIAGVGATVGPVYGVTFGGLVVLGFASGITDVAMNVSGAANERALGRSIMPVFHAFFSFGTMLGAGLGALAEAFGVPIAVHLGVIAVVMAGSILAAVRFVPRDTGAEAEHAEESTTWRERLAIWRDPRTLLVGVVVLAAAFAEGSANDWLALAMVDGHGVPNATGALVFGVFVTAMTAGRLGGVVLLDRFGRVPVLRASFLLAAVGLLLIIVVPNPWVATAGAVLWGLGAALGFPVGMSAAADDPRTAAARVSAVATIGYFAFLVGPPVIGFLGHQVGILPALLVVLILCAIGLIVAGATRPPATATAASETDTFADPGVPRA